MSDHILRHGELSRSGDDPTAEALDMDQGVEVLLEKTRQSFPARPRKALRNKGPEGSSGRIAKNIRSVSCSP